MLMGYLKSASTLAAMMMGLHIKWTKLAKERGINGFERKVIVDNVLVYSHDPEPLLQYFRAVLNVLKHHQATIKLKK